MMLDEVAPKPFQGYYWWSLKMLHSAVSTEQYQEQQKIPYIVTYAGKYMTTNCYSLIGLAVGYDFSPGGQQYRRMHAISSFRTALHTFSVTLYAVFQNCRCGATCLATFLLNDASWVSSRNTCDTVFGEVPLIFQKFHQEMNCVKETGNKDRPKPAQRKYSFR